MTAARTKETRRGTPEKRRKEETLSLAELQRRFQDAVMAGDDAILDLIPDNSRTSRSVLLGVYRHAYVSRLADIVCADFPILSRYLGEEAAGTMARAYIRACPSRHPNVRWFSSKLPDFLATEMPYAGHPEIRELAALERALSDAFDAEDAPILDLAELVRVPPERWGDLRFTPHPSATRLDLETNAFELWRALKDEGAPRSPTRLDERQRLVVWRRDTTSTVRSLGAEEAMMWDEATKAVPFSRLCELAAVYADPDAAPLRAAQYLQAWIGAGLLSRAELRPGRRQGR